MSENPEINTPKVEKTVEDYCQEVLGEDFSNFQTSHLVNRYTGKTKADEISDAIESFIRVENDAIKDIDIEDLNSIMYLEEIREKKEIEKWKSRGADINVRDIPNIYDAMAIDEKITAGEYLRNIPQIIAKLSENR
ncbi:hypothetical protein IJG79_00205 [Candidatus Saccharibacteria bacterium]|nr:hypothetical protein [Candidatus Saccharibacteria bacterium]